MTRRLHVKQEAVVHDFFGVVATAFGARLQGHTLHVSLNNISDN